MEDDVNEEQDEFDNDNDFDESTMDPLLIEDDEGPCSPSEFLIFPDHHQGTNFKQEQIDYIMENNEDLPRPR